MDSAKIKLFIVLLLGLNGFFNCERPAVVNIGAILTYNSVIGRVAKAAIEVAVADVNSDKRVLAGTQLNLIMEDNNCNPFLGTVGALEVIEKKTIAIIGPQSSTTAHMISNIANGLQIPLLSFSATDPTLSPLQYPFFLRMAQSDSYQMAAIADFINYFGWRQVIGIYVDNQYGRNGISSLEEELSKNMSKIYKIPLPLGTPRGYIKNVLQNSKNFGPRVYVVHATPDSGLEIFSVAQELHMMTDGYVWLVTDWLCTALDTSDPVGHTLLQNLQGIVGFCQYIPESREKGAFVSKWKELHRKGVVASELNAYGFYAYDAVWAVAYAINDFFKEHSGNITFTSNNDLIRMKGKIRFDNLKSFDGGNLLLKKLLAMNFTGVTGQIQLDGAHSLKSDACQINNIYGNMIHTVGHWTNHSGLTIALPNSLHGNDQKNFSGNQILGNITWPGGKTSTPRGWVVATRDKPLRIAVPNRVTFVEFVTATEDNRSAKGYCIDIFEAAVKLLPYDVPHQFLPFGDGQTTPSYWQLVNMVANNNVDAAVGDITIVKNRTKIADFTQPYLSSGLVIVVPVRTIKTSPWNFLRPFNLNMWVVTLAYFFLIGAVVWLLEHRVNPDFRGPPKQQCVTMFLFSFSSLFHTQKEDTVSGLARFVMVVWFFLLLVVTSSYTASLTSFLTVQQLASPINGIDSLIATHEPIGYQESSFSRVYMIDTLKIPTSRLVSLRPPEGYAKALRLGPKNGGVAAIVDELPYVELFLRAYNEFTITGEAFARRGWGFAFPRGSPLSEDLSRAILNLSENGKLQKIHDKWFCNTSSCSSTQAKSNDPYQLDLYSFWGMFMICAVVCVASILVFFLKTIRQFVRYKSKHRDPGDVSSKGCSQVIYNFFDFIDKKEEAVKNMFKQEDDAS